tara:strand:- start:2088 stop:2597 length:510 start_codon:yes stop_codon:yes gene_type:complete
MAVPPDELYAVAYVTDPSASLRITTLWLPVVAVVFPVTALPDDVQATVPSVHPRVTVRELLVEAACVIRAYVETRYKPFESFVVRPVGVEIVRLVAAIAALWSVSVSNRPPTAYDPVWTRSCIRKKYSNHVLDTKPVCKSPPDVGSISLAIMLDAAGIGDSFAISALCL